MIDLSAQKLFAVHYAPDDEYSMTSILYSAFTQADGKIAVVVQNRLIV
jgi:hypothetical protein